MAKTFKAETLSDYWLGNNRIKGTVKIMGTPDRKVRFNGLSPAGGNVILDLMCDGTDFVLVDYLCTPTGGTLQAGDDVSHAEWAHFDALAPYDLTDKATAILARARRMLPIP